MVADAGRVVTLAFPPGTTFAGYRVESLVGRGGMGVVYRAIDLSLTRPVALKLIAPELAEDKRFRTRFLRESRLAASLDHPNVVPIYEAGERDGQLYLAMRYVNGGDLKTMLRRRGRFACDPALSLLAQIADALDAAHRHALVHRDVKPANVLVDDDGHAYLTDFGLTKQLGGASTQTGELVGTLDYLAPEQIRGDTVDARTDCYALACVLYECLAGSPPFRRETEAETLWAHMQEPFAPLHDQPALGPVLEKGLAKNRDQRYGSCGELVADARRALDRASALGWRRRLAPARVRRRLAIQAIGVLVLLVAVIAAFVALTGHGAAHTPTGNGIAAITGAGRVRSFAQAHTAPANLAVGEGAVWALDSEAHTISRLDARTGKVVRTFKTGGRPSDLAVGAGAVWIGNAGAEAHRPHVTVSVSRIDPRSTRVTGTVKLPDSTGGTSGSPTVGLPRLAVGNGAVWAIDPDYTLSRIDAKTGRLVTTIKVPVAPTTLAAGKDGIWFLGWESRSVMRLDAHTNRIAETIPVGGSFLSGVAVGAGAVWVTSPDEGLLWRIEPGPTPIMRTIDVGFGATYVAFGDGAIWTGNFVDGTVSRIDPRTNAVTARVPVGASQALAAGAGSAWVAVAARTRDGSLPAPTCSEVISGGGKPDVLLASDLPLQGGEAADPRASADIIRSVLKDHDFRAGKYAVGYQSCDDSTAQTGGYEPRKCAANANAYASARQLVAVIGPYNSGCARVEIPILNRTPAGPLAVISPSNDQPDLTRGGRLALPPPLGTRGAPDVYYPTGVRNYVRLLAPDYLQGVAQAMLAKRLGLGGVYLLHDPTTAGDVSWTGPFRRTASRLGVRVAGSAAFDPAAKSYDALARKVARSRADGVLIGGELYAGGDRLLRALRARLGRRAALMSGEGFTPISEVVRLAGRAARGLFVATSDVPPDALDLSFDGRRFTHDYGSAAQSGYALQTAQATDLVMRAIARSDGSRASVLRAIRTMRVRRGLLGSFRFDRYGDITPPKITILRITGSTPADLHLPSYLLGAIVDHVFTVPPKLVE